VRDAGDAMLVEKPLYQRPISDVTLDYDGRLS
jgi:hypothetical protein